MIKPKAQIGHLYRTDDIGAGRNLPVLLDKNERTVPYEDELFRQLLASLDAKDLSKYPDQSGLYERLANFLGIDKEYLLLVSGADSGLKLFFETFLEPQQQLVTVAPTYAMINVYANMFGANIIDEKYDTNLHLDVASFINSIGPDTRMVVLPNPNQPTGTLLDSFAIENIVHKESLYDTIVLIDEAYLEFANTQSAVSLIPNYPNLCILRTFSKAWGLAGVRLGYVVGTPNIIKEVRKTKSLLDINILAIKAALFLLEHHNLVLDYISEIRQAKNLVLHKLSSHGIKTISSYTNFIHIELPEHVNAATVSKKLEVEGYSVRIPGGTATVLDGCMRITIGPQYQMTKFIDRLISILVSSEPDTK